MHSTGDPTKLTSTESRLWLLRGVDFEAQFQFHIHIELSRNHWDLNFNYFSIVHSTGVAGVAPLLELIVLRVVSRHANLRWCQTLSKQRSGLCMLIQNS